MNAPLIYLAAPTTSEFIGTSFADPDPLNPGSWLLPAHAYLEAPPATPAGSVAVRRDDGWELTTDYRGTVFSTANGEPTQHVQLGALPDGFTVDPRPSADHLWNGSSWVLDASLQATNQLALQSRLFQQVDTAADTARRAVAGDPLRAVEYDRARIEAEQFTAAGYLGDVPPMVAAWAISGRTPQQAAESILAEAAQYTAALVQLRTVRLQAKELIRAAINAGNIEHAQDIAAETIAAIEAAVAGIGNNT